MELLDTETLGPVPANAWASMSSFTHGPGAAVFLVHCPLGTGETMRVQVHVNPEGAGSISVIEDFTTIPADTALYGGEVGFQSAPVPLVDATWWATIWVRHTSATDQSFIARAILL